MRAKPHAPGAEQCPRRDPDCPHPCQETMEAMEFRREKKMVDWLAPAQLARTGVRAGIAATFGSYADKREMQAALSRVTGPDDDYSQAGELWFDYVADLGDGFGPTYALASLLTRELAHEETPLRRGNFVLLGGDQVYPTASRNAYQNRFLGPYRAAFPHTPHDPERGVLAPAMYAIPGNHDWYDGLTSFIRIFCQRRQGASTRPDDDAGTGRWIGGWRTRQRRSYFAIRLPHDWWIWGIDSQLESDMDHPQLDYFNTLAAEMRALAPAAQHKIILLTAEPSWVQCPGDNAMKNCRRNTEAFNTLAHFEKRYIRSKGFQLKLVLSGDLHHYLRYESGPAGTVRITSGGGGAFLLGTEWMPSELKLREGTRETVAAEEPPVTYRRAASFPTRRQSHRLGWGVFALPLRNRSFTFFLSIIYLLFAWLLQTGSRGAGGDVFTGGSLLAGMQHDLGFWNQVEAFAKAFLFSPASSVFLLVVVGGLTAFTWSQAKGHHWVARLLGFLHAVAHVILCCTLMAAIATAMTGRYKPGDEQFNMILIAGLLLLGGLCGALLFAAFLFVTSRLTGVHVGELFSSMAISGYKNFLRLRLDASGKLTVYTIGLKTAPNDWTFRAPGKRCGAPWFESATFGEGDAAARVVDKFELS